MPLTVVTFNIHSGIGRNGLQLAQVAGEIAAVEPDVVLLQEVDQNRLRSRFVDEADYLATLLGMEHVFASNVERDGLRAGDPVSDYGTAVLTRLRIESWTHTLLPNRPGRQQRGLQHLVLRLGGRPISIYNAHLDHTTPSLRQQQMRLARDIIGVDSDPVIFGGDFNASRRLGHPRPRPRPRPHRPGRPVAARRRRRRADRPQQRTPQPDRLPARRRRAGGPR